MSDRHAKRSDGEIPSIKDLRTIVQGGKISGDRRWTYRFFRRISIYITWLLLHTKATPNQVTVASLVVAAAGIVLVAFSSPWIALLGYALLIGYHLLDRVDGEIARFRGLFSLRGIYLDNAGHYLTGAGVFIATTYRYAPLVSDSQIIWLIGTIGALASVMSRVEKHASFQLFSQYVLEHPQLAEGISAKAGSLTRAATREDRAEGSPQHRPGLLVVARDVALTLTSFPIVVAGFIVGLVVTVMTDAPTVGIVILIGAAALQTVTYFALEVVNLSANLDTETRRLFEIAEGLKAEDPKPEQD